MQVSTEKTDVAGGSLFAKASVSATMADRTLLALDSAFASAPGGLGTGAKLSELFVGLGACGESCFDFIAFLLESLP